VEQRNYVRILGVLTVFALTPVAVRVIEANIGLSQFVYFYGIVSLLAVVGLLLVWKRRTALLGLVMVAAITVDLFVVGYNFNTKLPNDHIFRPTSSLRLLKQDNSNYRVAVLADDPIYHPNILSYFKIASIDGYSTVLPQRYLAYVKKVVGEATTTANGIMFLFRADVRALRMMNVKYIISDKPLPGTNLQLVLRNNASYVYRIKNALGRVYCASNYFRSKDSSASMGRVKTLIRDYDRPALVVGGELEDGAQLTQNCQIHGLKVYTNGLQFHAYTGKPSYAVLPYNYSTNWKIRINGKPARLYRTNYEFMGFDVPKGENRVEIHYANDMGIITAIVFIIVGLVLVFYGVLIKRGNMAGLLFCLLGGLVVWKNVYSLPGVRNDKVPERPVVRTVSSEPINTLGLDRIRNAAPSKIVTLQDTYKDQFVSPLNGLRGVGIFVATYRQKSLPYDITVVLRDVDSRRTYKQTFKGAEVWDNMWLNLRFPEIANSKNRRFTIEVTVPVENRQHPFSVWLDSNHRACLVTYHDPAKAYR